MLPDRNLALESVGAKVGVFSCYACSAVWIDIDYTRECPDCGGGTLTQSWIEMHDPNEWWGYDSWDFPIVVKR